MITLRFRDQGLRNFRRLTPICSSLMRHFSGDKDKDDVEKALEESNKLEVAKEKEDKVMKAREKLESLLTNMKIDNTVMKSKSVISKVMAKPEYHVRRSARPIVFGETDAGEEKIDDVSKGIDKRLVMAAKVIVNTLGDEKVKKRTETELMQMLKAHADETKDAREGKVDKTHDLAEIFLGMKIDKSKPKSGPGKFTMPIVDKNEMEQQSQSESSSMSRSKQSQSQHRLPPLPVRARKPMSVRTKFDLYASQPLDIWEKNMKEADDLPVLNTWNRLMKQEIESILVQPPTNAYEEMIQWTEQGKLWKFPIDNEQGMEEEANVPFYDHVLLDHLLEGFPEKGPVRQFMELVILGLSNNPYITVERKKETVGWFKTYFDSQEDVLREAGALG